MARIWWQHQLWDRRRDRWIQRGWKQIKHRRSKRRGKNGQELLRDYRQTVEKSRMTHLWARAQRWLSAVKIQESQRRNTIGKTAEITTQACNPFKGMRVKNTEKWLCVRTTQYGKGTVWRVCFLVCISAQEATLHPPLIRFFCAVLLSDTSNLTSSGSLEEAVTVRGSHQFPVGQSQGIV